MNKNTKIVLGLLAVSIVLSCKEAADHREENAIYSESAMGDSTSVISSSAAVENKNSNRKFVRTADVKSVSYTHLTLPTILRV